MLLKRFSDTQAEKTTGIDPQQVVDLGSGDQTVLFLHGLFGSPHHWQQVMERLSDRYRVIAPQLPVDYQPGRRQHGINAIADLSNQVREMIDAMDIEPFVICGNSLGGLIAIELCAGQPDYAKGLVLAGSAGLFERSPIGGSRPRPSKEFIRKTVTGIVHRKELVTEELIDDWYTSVSDRDYVRFVLRVSRATRDRTVEDELSKLDLPTMIIWGHQDTITPPSTGREFQRRIKGSRLEFIDDCGHAPNWEQPEAFADLLDEFLPTCFAE
ncbi:alpha/beta fold hydrolase [Roseiconus lacunae]|uniref:Alpha/beta hydrolase n=1 Tax=Roseiconus lacunae TaxID=2605694 RepID=A0ABT7PG97_9BACT|nr:alpha/beta hydrolase [Roseiconus lacunae]MCD0460455.1 alpha/beta hydrolase [Roseiconus lacunae]MDM4015498.1 alpha/beta hydrolase [Roseiconus lacunae]WRQ52825.1 alpha/beta hydrolase [Stieleria sp. HD01]